MEKLLDANAVLRYLLEDIQEQSDCVAETIEAGVYHVSRSDIAESLGILLDEVTCRRKRVAAAALGLYSGSSFDFVDCVLAAEVSENGREALIFDKKLQSLFSRVA